VGVQIRWRGGALTELAKYTFLYGKGNENHELDTVSFLHSRNALAVMRVEFVSDGMPYILPTSCWGHIFVLKVHAPTEDKTDYVHESFYEELEPVFDKFPKYHVKSLLKNEIAKVGRRDVFNRQLGMNVYTKLIKIMELE
jgi:hypothetical protein